jgi:hypothetical protein
VRHRHTPVGGSMKGCGFCDGRKLSSIRRPRPVGKECSVRSFSRGEGRFNSDFGLSNVLHRNVSMASAVGSE